MSWTNGLVALIVGIVLVFLNGLLPVPLSTLCFVVGVILAVVGLVFILVGLTRGGPPVTRV
jgi:hypothetical protein